MADDEKEGEVIPARGADWEVVSLTASTYAAAPDSKGFDPNDDSESGQESSSAMFMSDHFVFPPSEHENLPVEPSSSEIHSISEGKTVLSVEEGEEERHDKLDDDSQGTEFFDDGSTFSAHGGEFVEAKGLEGVYTIPYPENTETSNPSDSPNQDFNSPHKNTKSSDGDNYDGSGHPCAAWWKKNASSLSFLILFFITLNVIFIIQFNCQLPLNSRFPCPIKKRQIKLNGECRIFRDRILRFDDSNSCTYEMLCVTVLKENDINPRKGHVQLIPCMILLIKLSS